LLVVDASLAVDACLGDRALELDGPLYAPPLFWSETRSAIHEAVWRGLAGRTQGERAHRVVNELPIESREPPELGSEAWRIADELGWAKTYDAEYVALASLLGCRLVTLDARMRRGADRLGFVVGPLEL